MPGEARQDVRLLEWLGILEPPPCCGLLGVDAQGQPVVYSLRQANPTSLWIAGPARCGKSELLRALLLSLAWSTSPEDLWVVAVDFSGLQLGMIEHLPHAALPVVVERRRASALVRWLVDEVMWRRATGTIARRICCAIDGEAPGEMGSEIDWKASLAWLARQGPAVAVHMLATGQAGARNGEGEPPAAGPGLWIAESTGETGTFTLHAESREQLLHAAWMPVHDLVACLEGINRPGLGLPLQAVKADMERNL